MWADAVGILGMQGFNLLYLLTVYYPAFKNGWWYVFTNMSMEFAYAFTFVIGIIMIPEITLPVRASKGAPTAD